MINYLIPSIIIILVLVTARTNYVQYKKINHDLEFLNYKYKKLEKDYKESLFNIDELAVMISGLRAENDKMAAQLFEKEFLK